MSRLGGRLVTGTRLRRWCGSVGRGVRFLDSGPGLLGWTGAGRPPAAGRPPLYGTVRDGGFPSTRPFRRLLFGLVLDEFRLDDLGVFRLGKDLASHGVDVLTLHAGHRNRQVREMLGHTGHPPTLIHHGLRVTERLPAVLRRRRNPLRQLPGGRFQPHGLRVRRPRAVGGSRRGRLRLRLRDLVRADHHDLRRRPVLHDRVRVGADQVPTITAEPVDLVIRAGIASRPVGELVVALDDLDDHARHRAGAVDQFDQALVADDPLDDALLALLRRERHQVELLGARRQAALRSRHQGGHERTGVVRRSLRDLWPGTQQCLDAGDPHIAALALAEMGRQHADEALPVADDECARAVVLRGGRVLGCSGHGWSPFGMVSG